MAGKFHHESIYRGADALERLGQASLILCGAGALGSLLADNLARQGFRRLRVIDRDRIEEHNVNTQLYAETDVGAWKAEILKNHLFRAVGIEIDAVAKELSDKNARKLLGGLGGASGAAPTVVLDTFDNSASRQLVQTTCRAAGTKCLHVGLYADYAEAIWDEQYRVPQDVAGDVCDYPVARNLVLLAVTVASESLIRFILAGEARNWTATLGDLAVRELEA